MSPRVFISQMNRSASARSKPVHRSLKWKATPFCSAAFISAIFRSARDDGVDGFGFILAIGHEREFAGNRVHHASAHGDDDGFDNLPQSCFAQCMDAPSGERQIDGAPALMSHPAHVGTALVEPDRRTRDSLAKSRSRRTGQSRADQATMLSRSGLMPRIGIRIWLVQAWYGLPRVPETGACPAWCAGRTSLRYRRYRGARR